MVSKGLPSHEHSAVLCAFLIAKKAYIVPALGEEPIHFLWVFRPVLQCPILHYCAVLYFVGEKKIGFDSVDFDICGRCAI